MPVAVAESRKVAEEEKAEPKRKESEARKVAKIFELFDAVSKTAKKAQRTPSSIMMQVLKYGKAFKRVIQVVQLDYGNFEKAYREFLVENPEAHGRYVPLYKKSYAHRWGGASPVPPEKIEHLMEPLQNLGIVDLTFKKPPKINPFFAEAVNTYIVQERVSGISFFNEESKSLVIFSKVRGQTPKFSLADALQDYYVLLRIEPGGDGKINVTFSCTCPWALGMTKDRRGKRIPPEFTSMCKHGIATLFYFYPEILAYLKVAKEGRLSRQAFEAELATTRKAFEEFQKRLVEYVQKHPDHKDAVFSNASYLMWREFFNNFANLGSMRKFVPRVEAMYIFEELWNSLTVKKVETVVESRQETGEEGEVADVGKVMELISKEGIYGRLEKLKELLNGLQGSRITTLYTKALIAGLILGSDLETDPVIVSVVGDPGTGKTLTAEGLARLVGITTVVVEREVRRGDLLTETAEAVRGRIAKCLEAFRNLVLPKVDPRYRDDAEKFFEKILNDAVSAVAGGDAKQMARVAKRFAETFASLYGLRGARPRKAVARLIYSAMKANKEMFEKYAGGKALERKALEERRRMLVKLAELGLLANPEEKENVNSGSVRWGVAETSEGYRVRVYVDLHYLIRAYNGNVSKIVGALQELAKLGRVSIKTEVPGLAELKLSEAEYLEKALRVREEDILSPARRLIWVGGDLTKKSLILIDESRRAPELLERLLTDLSTAGRDTRRTNIIVTTDNAEPLMEAESDPRLDAFHSRINFEIVTPSATVAYTIGKTLEEISRIEREGKAPLITLDEALLLNYVSKGVELPERYEKVLYSVPLLLIYDFKVLRPEVALAPVPQDKLAQMPPLILLTPKGSVEFEEVKGDYEDVNWGASLPPIRMMPERRFGHHVVRASKALATVEKKPVVDEDTFLSALEMTLLARVIPAGSQFPYAYLDAKRRVAQAIVDKVRDFLSRKETATERLIELMGSMSPISGDDLKEALEEMVSNPVATAVFVRFLEQMLVSENAEEFVKYAKKIPGLYGTLELIARYEKIYFTRFG